MLKWIPLPLGNKVEYSYPNTCLVTTERPGWNGKRRLEQAYQGWDYSNNYVVAYMEVEPITKNPDGWLSEHRGSEPPPESEYYLVTLEREQWRGSISRYQVKEMYFDHKKQSWRGVPDNCEVVAYRPRPKPYKGARRK